MHANNNYVIFQKEEINLGCCDSGYHPNQLLSTKFSKIRVYSEPKESKSKKIGLTLIKKNHSQNKAARKTLQSQMVSSRPWKDQQQKLIDKQIVTLGSKFTTAKHSLKSSRIPLNKQLQMGNFIPQFNHKSLTCRTNKQNTQNKKPTKTDQQPNLQYLSEISKIQQEFISQESANLHFLSFFNNCQSKSKRITNNCLSPQFLPQKATPNPLERLLDRKKYDVKTNKLKKKLQL